jgi:hypothetical protein
MKTKDPNGVENRVPKVIDMHLNAIYKESTSKMATDIEIMRCQIADVQRAAMSNITEMEAFERSLVFASLADLRKECNSILKTIDLMAERTRHWTFKTYEQCPKVAVNHKK